MPEHHQKAYGIHEDMHIEPLELDCGETFDTVGLLAGERTLSLRTHVFCLEFDKVK